MLFSWTQNGVEKKCSCSCTWNDGKIDSSAGSPPAAGLPELIAFRRVGGHGRKRCMHKQRILSWAYRLSSGNCCGPVCVGQLRQRSLPRRPKIYMGQIGSLQFPRRWPDRAPSHPGHGDVAVAIAAAAADGEYLRCGAAERYSSSNSGELLPSIRSTLSQS